MPIYEYSCSSCGAKLEFLQKVSDDPKTTCTACGQTALQKLISPAGFRLKGGGWYETDFKQDKKKNLADAPASNPATNASNPASATASATSSDTAAKSTTGDQ